MPHWDAHRSLGAIVSGPSVRVAKELVGLADRDELCRGRPRVVRADVRVQAVYCSAIGTGQLARSGVRPNPQDLVRIVHRHRRPHIALARANIVRGRRVGVPEFRTASWSVVAEPIADVDTTASDMLQNLDVGLNDDGVHLVFAGLKDPVRHKIDRYELTGTIDSSQFFPTPEAAIAAFQAESGCKLVSGGPADRA